MACINNKTLHNSIENSYINNETRFSIKSPSKNMYVKEILTPRANVDNFQPLKDHKFEIARSYNNSSHKTDPYQNLNPQLANRDQMKINSEPSINNITVSKKIANLQYAKHTPDKITSNSQRMNFEDQCQIIDNQLLPTHKVINIREHHPSQLINQHIDDLVYPSIIMQPNQPIVRT